MKTTKYKFEYNARFKDGLIDSRGYFSFIHAELEIARLKSLFGYDSFSDITSYEIDEPQIVKFDGDNITRVEFIGTNGRDIIKTLDKFKFLLQDDGRTLKICGDIIIEEAVSSKKDYTDFLKSELERIGDDR